MSDLNTRTVGLAARRRINELVAKIAPLKVAADAWNLEGDDAALPSMGSMKTVLETYEGIQVLPLRIFEEIQEIKAGESAPIFGEGSINVNLEWSAVQNKPATFPPSAHTHPADEISGLPTGGGAADWNTLANKPATFPPDAHQHPRRYLSLSVSFHGALTAGQTQMVIVPYGVQSATLLRMTYAMGNTGTSSYTSFGLDAFYNDVWVSCLTNPAFSGMAISAGGRPIASSQIQHEIDMGRMALPKTEWYAEDLLRVTLVQAAPGAIDAVVTLNFDATDWLFDEE